VIAPTTRFPVLPSRQFLPELPLVFLCDSFFDGSIYPSPTSSSKHLQPDSFFGTFSPPGVYAWPCFRKPSAVSDRSVLSFTAPSRFSARRVFLLVFPPLSSFRASSLPWISAHGTSLQADLFAFCRSSLQLECCLLAPLAISDTPLACILGFVFLLVPFPPSSRLRATPSSVRASCQVSRIGDVLLFPHWLWGGVIMEVPAHLNLNWGFRLTFILQRGFSVKVL